MSTTYPSSGLPEQWFHVRSVVGNEVYFKPQTQLNAVLVQGNSVYLVLDTPHNLTRIFVTFPNSRLVRVYRDRVWKSRLVAKAGDESWPYQLTPKPIRYRFGMRLSPYLFGAYLPREHEHLLQQDAIVHYPVLASSSGHSGALIRVGRYREHYQNYWLEIYSFTTGNEELFNAGWQTHPQTKLLARFRPGGEGLNAGKLWVPEAQLALAA